VAIGDKRGEGAALGNTGVALLSRGETQKAIELLERHRAIAEALGDKRAVRHALTHLADAYYTAGDEAKHRELSIELLRMGPVRDDSLERAWNGGDGELPKMFLGQVELGGDRSVGPMADVP
jgi:hypothetical protein